MLQDLSSGNGCKHGVITELVHVQRPKHVRHFTTLPAAQATCPCSTSVVGQASNIPKACPSSLFLAEEQSAHLELLLEGLICSKNRLQLRCGGAAIQRRRSIVLRR